MEAGSRGVRDVPGCLEDFEASRYEGSDLVEGEVDLFGVGDAHLDSTDFVEGEEQPNVDFHL